MGIIALGDYRACFAVGDYLYIVDSFASTLLIVDISDPESPSTVATFTLPVEDPTGVIVYHGVCYVACSDNVLIINVDNPASPVVEKTIAMSGADLRSMQVVADQIFVAGNQISHVDASLAEDATGVVIEDLPGVSVGDIAIEGRRLYEVDDAGGKLRSYRVGGFYCAFIATGAFEADDVATETIRARHGYFAGDLVASGVMIVGGNSEEDSGAGRFAAYIKLGPLYMFFGSASPEGAVSAPAGSLFLNVSGGAGTSFYVKESGSGNTGWQGK